MSADAAPPPTPGSRDDGQGGGAIASRPRIGLIWAEAAGGAIGQDGGMPWYLPEDLQHFKATTLRHPVVMGRRTWESLPASVRPLPGRRNIVVTRTEKYHAEGAEIAGSLDEAIASGSHESEIWVIGGGVLFSAALPVADELVVTRIDLETLGADAFAPEIDAAWVLADAGTSEVSRTGLRYRIERWVRADARAGK